MKKQQMTMGWKEAVVILFIQTLFIAFIIYLILK